MLWVRAVIGGVFLAVAAMSATILFNAPVPSGGDASASHAGGADAVSIDMDPEDNPPAGFNHGADPSQASFTPVNTASSIGPRQACARINENNVLDADEDVTADRLTFDITIEHVTAPGAIGLSTRIFYSEVNNLRVFSINPNLFLAQLAGSNVLDFSNPTPDANNNNEYKIDLLDIGGPAAAETGTGTIVRATIETKSTVATGLYPLNLDETDTYYVDANGNPVPAEPPDPNFAVRDATLAVNQACPLPPADAEMLSASIVFQDTSDNPITQATAGTAFRVRTLGSARNNGPNVADLRVTFTLTLPPGCTTSTPNPQTQDFLNVAAGATVNGARNFAVTCQNPSSHQFSVAARVDIIGGATESNPANNGPLDGTNTIPVFALADPKVTGVSVNAPLQAATGAAFNVTVEADLHNNGAFGPVNADVLLDLAVPTDCARSPNAPQLLDNQSLGVSTAASVQATWSVTCTTVGLKTLNGSASLSVDQLHVSDSNPDNNTGQAQAVTDTSLGAADLKVTSVTVTSPPSVPVSTEFEVSVDTTVHNNGPVAPVNADVQITLNLPADCFTPVKKVKMEDALLGPSINARLPRITFFVACLDHSFHDITATAVITIDDPLAGDATPGNNTLTSDPRTTAIIRTADLKVVGATLTAPASAVVNTPFGLTVNATVHNNGPHSAPADAVISLSLPPDCSTGPNPAVAALSLPVSTPTSISHTFSVVCSSNSFHAFEASVSLAGPLHVEDPDPSNNAQGAGSVTVPVFAQADLKVSGALVSVPSQAAVGAPFNVSVTANIHNNGPFTPANGDVSILLTLPPDCTTADTNPRPVNDVSLPASSTTQVKVTWSVTCGAHSTHSFTGTPTVTLDALHVADPNTTNNSGSSSPTSLAVVAQADGKISSAQILNPPMFIQANTNIAITIRKTLHNNGPFGPTNFRLTKSAVAPSGCTVTPPPTSDHLLTVSVPTTVDEVWTIKCAPGTYTFQFSNALSATELHVADPVTVNNVSTLTLTVAVDTDGDGIADNVELGCGSNPNNSNSIPERIDGAFAGVDDDGDTAVDEPLPPGATDFDCDGDGYKGSAENHVYAPSTRGDQDPCGTNSSPPTDPPSPIGWPADLSPGGGVSVNKLDLLDVASFIGPVRYLNTNLGTNPGDRRWDVVPGKVVGDRDINLVDLANLVLLRPPMLGGQRAFNGPLCPWPP